MKKLISILISICMIFSITNISISANGSNTYFTDGDYEYIVLDDDTACITGYTGTATKLVLPDELDGYAVTLIGEDALAGKNSLTEITLSDSITRIALWGIWDCPLLETVNFGSSVENYDMGVFVNCPSLSAINVDEDNPYFADIDGVLFNKNFTEIILCPVTKSGEYVIPDGITTIGAAFNNCDLLTNIVIPDGVTTIEYNAFGCELLTSIILPDSVREIRLNAFSHCVSLESIAIPEGVTVIEETTFGYCTSLANVTLPDSITEIWDDAFTGCENLTSINLSGNVTEISDSAFENCPKLTIYGHSGTYAETYAKENNIPFEVVKKEIEFEKGFFNEEVYKYYDKNGVLTKETIKYNGGSTTTKEYTYEYDENGNLVKETISWNNGEKNVKTYEYDENNNLIEEAQIQDYYDQTLYTKKYDSDGNLIEKIEDYSDGDGHGDAYIRKYMYEYDSSGKMTKSSLYYDDILHSSDTYEYDENGRNFRTLSVITDPQLNIDYTREYDENGKIIGGTVITNSEKPTTFYYTYEYDENGRVLEEITNWNGGGKEVKTYEYDNYGSYRYDIMNYDSNGDWYYIASESSHGYENADPITLETVYGDNGKIVKEVIYAPDISDYSTDVLTTYYYVYEENVIEPDLTSDIYRYYDKDGNLTKEINNEITTSYEYDSKGNIIKEVTENSGERQSVYTYEYDKNNNRIKGYITEGQNAGAEYTYEYDEHGSLVKQIWHYGDEDDVFLLTFYKKYDEYGRVISDNDGFYEYDAAGNMIKKTQDFGDGDIRTYLYEYDNLGNMIKEIKDFGIVYVETTFEYDDKGSMTKQTIDESGYVTVINYHNVYDENSDVPKLDEDVNEYDIYQYFDKDGVLFKEVFDYGENGNVYSNEYEYEYDEFGNVSKKTSESSNGYLSVYTYEYDEHGNLLQEVNDFGTEVYIYGYAYDENNNLIEESETHGYGNEPRYTYKYDSDGKLREEIFDYGERSTYAYDKNGYLIEKLHYENDILTRTYTYENDENGKAIGGTYVNSNGDSHTFVCTYKYDENGRISEEITNWNNDWQEVKTYEYDDFGGWYCDSVSSSPGGASGSYDLKHGDPFTIDTEYDADGNIVKEVIYEPRIRGTDIVNTYHYIYEENLTYGDLNADGNVGLADLIMMKKFLAGYDVLVSSSVADLSNDGKVNGVDLAVLKNLVISG